VSDRRFELVVATRFLNRPGGLWTSVPGFHGLTLPKEQRLAVALPPASIIIDKETYGIPEEGLISLVEKLQGANVHLAGIETDVSVTIVAAQLFDHGIAPYILADCTASRRGSKYTERALLTLERIVGAQRVMEPNNNKSPSWLFSGIRYED
jgi:nicotinamidase-related amidase